MKCWQVFRILMLFRIISGSSSLAFCEQSSSVAGRAQRASVLANPIRKPLLGRRDANR